MASGPGQGSGAGTSSEPSVVQRDGRVAVAGAPFHPAGQIPSARRQVVYWFYTQDIYLSPNGDITCKGHTHCTAMHSDQTARAQAGCGLGLGSHQMGYGTIPENDSKLLIGLHTYVTKGPSPEIKLFLSRKNLR